MDDLTIIIPAKNESESIGVTISEIEKFGYNYIIVVSKDDLNTVSAINNKQNIVYQKNRGFGDAIISGINEVRTQYFAIMFVSN